MTVSKRLVALALLVAAYTLFVWVPMTKANAADCQLMEDEMAEAAIYRAAEPVGFVTEFKPHIRVKARSVPT